MQIEDLAPFTDQGTLHMIIAHFYFVNVNREITTVEGGRQ